MVKIAKRMGTEGVLLTKVQKKLANYVKILGDPEILLLYVVLRLQLTATHEEYPGAAMVQEQ